MIQQILDAYSSLVRLAAANPVVFGGLLAFLGGTVVSLVKSIPQKLWNSFLYFTTTSISLDSDSPMFRFYSLWMAKKKFLSKSRQLYVSESGSGEVSTAAMFSSKNKSGFTEDNSAFRVSSKWGDYTDMSIVPDMGSHWFFYKGTFVWLTYSRKESTSNGGGYQYIHKVNLRLFTRNKAKAIEMLSEAFHSSIEDSNVGTAIYTPGTSVMDKSWNHLDTKPARSIDSVILPADDKKRLVADIEDFIGKTQWYIDKGIPYRRGYLFYGSPGCGKTSLALAIAGMIGSSVYLMSLSSFKDDNELWKTTSKIANGSIVLIEDADCISRDEGAVKGITLGGLLNVIDGAASKTGCIYILSTNHPENLDPALLRTGRLDLHLELKPATTYQAAELYNHLAGKTAPKSLIKEVAHNNYSMSDLQEAIIRHLFTGIDILDALIDVKSENLDSSQFILPGQEKEEEEEAIA